MFLQEVAAVAREGYRTSIIKSLNFQVILGLSLNVGDVVKSDTYTLGIKKYCGSKATRLGCKAVLRCMMVGLLFKRVEAQV